MRRRPDRGYATSAPQLDSVSPSSINTDSGQTLTLSGKVLNRVDRVTIGGSTSTLNCTSLSAANGTVMTCLTPDLSSLTTGDYDVTVYRGSLYYRLRQGLNVSSYVAPTISSVANLINTDIGDTEGGWTLTVTGTGFDGGGLTGITVGGSAGGSFTVVNATTATITVPTGLTAGQKDVVVTGPGGSATLTNGVRLWDPSQVTTTAWYRETRTTSGSDVTQWTDKSGNARHLTPPGTAPVVGATMNGQPTVDFPGTDQYLQGAANMNLIITDTAYTAYACFIVDAIDSASNAFNCDAVWSESVGGVAGMVLRDDSPKTASAYNYDGSEDEAASTITTGAAYYVGMRHDSGSMYSQAKTAAEVSAASGNTDASFGTAKLNVGTNYNHTKLFNGQIAELFFVASALSATVRGYARAYFATRYGIT